MNLLNIQISTWISICALVVSIIALIATQRKIKRDERNELAKQIANIKNELGTQVYIFEKMIKQTNKLELIASKLKGFDKSLIHTSQIKLLEEFERTKLFYEKLGYKDPFIKDPLILSSLAVEASDHSTRLKHLLLRSSELIKSIEMWIKQRHAD